MVSPEELDIEAASEIAAAQELEEEAVKLEMQGLPIRAQGNRQEAGDLRDHVRHLQQRALLMRQQPSGV